MKKETGKLFNTYIFDLYGTLVDIHTDESKDVLWDTLAGIYAAYGSDYTSSELHEAYDKVCKDEEHHLIKLMKVWHPEMELKHPEIDLTRVFARLLLEAENIHDTDTTISGKDIRTLSIVEIAQSDWAHFVSNTFRIISRDRLKCYENTVKTLQHLRACGCKTYLLSNAQGSFTRSELEMTGLLPYLDGVYISSEKQIKKPQPEFLEKLIKEYSIDKSTAVMVGNDMFSDMSIATACGVNGVYLNTFELDRKTINSQMKQIGAVKENIKIVMDGDIIHLIK